MCDDAFKGEARLETRLLPHQPLLEWEVLVGVPLPGIWAVDLLAALAFSVRPCLPTTETYLVQPLRQEPRKPVRLSCSVAESFHCSGRGVSVGCELDLPTVTSEVLPECMHTCLHSRVQAFAQRLRKQ